MRFSEQETALILKALRSRASECAVAEQANTTRQTYAGLTPQGMAAAVRRVDKYRAEREALDALIARFEYVAGAA